MRFTLTMPDDLVEQIDEEAERTGTPLWSPDTRRKPPAQAGGSSHVGGACRFRGAGDASPDRSLSHRTVWGSYTWRGTYSSGSASRPPGRAAPYLLTPIPPVSPKIPFLKTKLTRVGLQLLPGGLPEGGSGCFSPRAGGCRCRKSVPVCPRKSDPLPIRSVSSRLEGSGASIPDYPVLSDPRHCPRILPAADAGTPVVAWFRAPLRYCSPMGYMAPPPGRSRQTPCSPGEAHTLCRSPAIVAGRF